MSDTLTAMPFVPFPKIPRWSREIVATEKIDGTNAQVFISDDLSTVLAGSRNQWITPTSDNYGFAAWVAENADELRKLGPGAHFGEWWGAGIQRRYGLTEKRFSLFNVGRWLNNSELPKCCHVVPVLGRGVLSDHVVDFAMDYLRQCGSMAAPGFMKPEGVIIYHTSSGKLFKKTMEKDEKHKGEL